MLRICTDLSFVESPLSPRHGNGKFREDRQAGGEGWCHACLLVTRLMLLEFTAGCKGSSSCLTSAVCAIDVITGVILPVDIRRVRVSPTFQSGGTVPPTFKHYKSGYIS